LNYKFRTISIVERFEYRVSSCGQYTKILTFDTTSALGIDTWGANSRAVGTRCPYCSTTLWCF